MIKVNVKGLDRLGDISSKLVNMGITLVDIIVDELWEYAKVLMNDREIPDSYKKAMFVSVIPELNSVVLAVDVPDQYKYERFGNRKEWAIYECPRRHYNGGKIVPEYTGPNYIREKWEQYKPIFISKVKSRIGESIRR